MGLFKKTIKSIYGKIDAYVSKDKLTDDLDMLEKMCKYYYYHYYKSDRYEIAYTIADKGYKKDIAKEHAGFSRILGNCYYKGQYVKEDKELGRKYHKEDAFIRCAHDEQISLAILINWIYYEIQDLDDLLLALTNRVLCHRNEENSVRSYLLYKFILGLKEELQLNNINYISYQHINAIKNHIHAATLLACHCSYDEDDLALKYIRYSANHNEFFACTILIDDFYEKN